ncbi:MAG: DUF4258 domain-containing protein [Nitrospirae bacterium]|nr:DUF4258 domain-containing protein [Nitrospirota bacterium]
MTDHAISEGFKEGISVADMLEVIATGKVIERYPERDRCLVYGHRNDAIPIHVVIDFGLRSSVEIVTTYIPQRQQWIRDQRRKKRKH